MAVVTPPLQLLCIRKRLEEEPCLCSHDNMPEKGAEAGEKGSKTVGRKTTAEAFPGSYPLSHI